MFEIRGKIATGSKKQLPNQTSYGKELSDNGEEDNGVNVYLNKKRINKQISGKKENPFEKLSEPSYQGSRPATAFSEQQKKPQSVSSHSQQSN